MLSRVPRAIPIFIARPNVPALVGIAVYSAMAEYTAIPTNAGTFGLAMKIGIARGTLLSMTAGDTERLEYILAGGPLDRCADAEHHADKGEIVRSEERRVGK